MVASSKTVSGEFQKPLHRDRDGQKNIVDHIGLFQRLDLIPEEYITMPPEKRDQFVRNQIASNLMPGQISTLNKISMRVNRDLINI